MMRYAHEMNGNWYVWGQQPLKFVKSFRMVIQELRKYTCNTMMVWAPNIAAGYPWRAGNAVRGWVVLQAAAQLWVSGQMWPARSRSEQQLRCKTLAR